MPSRGIVLTHATSPCKDCPDRHVGCKAECERNIAFEKQCAEEREQRRIYRDMKSVRDAVFDYANKKH